jgi:C-5 cytosine-specific DNA methylase
MTSIASASGTARAGWSGQEIEFRRAAIRGGMGPVDSGEAPAPNYMKPLCIDLYCGLGGWAQGFLAEGYDVIGFDIERHDYGTGGYPGQLVLQDVTTLHGAQFKDAAVIVASPPCQAYSYRAMPWKRAKELPPPDNTLFEACFRIQREASEAAERHIPMVVENVRGAEKWVGPARWHFGSYYLWGEVPALMPPVIRAQKFNPDGTEHPPGSWFKIADSKRRGSKTSGGGSWFAIGRPGQLVTGANPVNDGGLKFGGGWWHDSTNNLIRKASSRSTARKAASAMIAKIPEPLARHIARTFKPEL